MSSADSREPASRLSEYLKSKGLAFNPFGALEAASDSRLLTYLVGHDAFENAWETDIGNITIIGPSGSGRTALVESLVYNCRVGHDSTDIFPVLLRENGGLLKSAAAESLPEIIYQPGRFEGTDEPTKRQAVAAIEAASPGLLDQLLPQITATGTYLPLSQYFDLPGGTLPNPPDKSRVRRVVQEIQGIQAGSRLDPGHEPLEALISVSPADEVMIIADIGRGRIERVTEAVEYTKRQLGNKKITVKLLLDTENPDRAAVLSGTKIEWWPEKLIEVLQKRLKMASGGYFESFDAISDPGLIDVEEKIVSDKKLAVATPRDAIAFANHLLRAGAETGDNFLTSEVFERVRKEFLRK